VRRKGTRVNPALGDQSGIPISRLRAKANKRRGDYIAARRKTRTLPGGRIVSLSVLPYNHRKLDWSDGVQQGPATVTLLTPPPIKAQAGATLWPTGGAFVAFIRTASAVKLDGGVLPAPYTAKADGGTVSSYTPTTIASGGNGKAA